MYVLAAKGSYVEAERLLNGEGKEVVRVREVLLCGSEWVWCGIMRDLQHGLCEEMGSVTIKHTKHTVVWDNDDAGQSRWTLNGVCPCLTWGDSAGQSRWTINSNVRVSPGDSLHT